MATVINAGYAEYFYLNSSGSQFIGIYGPQIAAIGNGFQQRVLKTPATVTITSGYSRVMYTSYGDPYGGYYIWRDSGYWSFSGC
jgi:hypothetical protein